MKKLYLVVLTACLCAACGPVDECQCTGEVLPSCVNDCTPTTTAAKAENETGL